MPTEVIRSAEQITSSSEGSSMVKINTKISGYTAKRMLIGIEIMRICFRDFLIMYETAS